MFQSNKSNQIWPNREVGRCKFIPFMTCLRTSGWSVAGRGFWARPSWPSELELAGRFRWWTALGGGKHLSPAWECGGKQTWLNRIWRQVGVKTTGFVSRWKGSSLGSLHSPDLKLLEAEISLIWSCVASHVAGQGYQPKVSVWNNTGIRLNN